MSGVKNRVILKHPDYGHILVIERVDDVLCLSFFSFFLDDDQLITVSKAATQIALYQARDPRTFFRFLIENACHELKAKPEIYPEE